MYAVFGLLGMLGGVISLIALIISAIKKKPKKKWVISFVAFFLVFVVAFILTPVPSEDDQAQSAPQVETEQPQEPDASPAAEAAPEAPECTHDWKEVSRTEPTEDAFGWSDEKCSLCGKERQLTIPKLEHKVTFDEIYHAYKQNELAADDKYQGNRYEITAKINGMTNDGLLNLTGGAMLTMETQVDNTIVFFYAEFEKDQEDALKKVSVGDTITFEGKCLDAGNWSDCELIS